MLFKPSDKHPKRDSLKVLSDSSVMMLGVLGNEPQPVADVYAKAMRTVAEELKNHLPGFDVDFLHSNKSHPNKTCQKGATAKDLAQLVIDRTNAIGHTDATIVYCGLNGTTGERGHKHYF